MRPDKLYRAFDFAGLLSARGKSEAPGPFLGISVAFSENFEMEGLSSMQCSDELVAGLGDILADEKGWLVRIFVFRGGGKGERRGGEQAVSRESHRRHRRGTRGTGALPARSPTEPRDAPL